MPISGPSGQSFPTAFLPDADTADMVGVSAGDALPYLTRMQVVRVQSNYTFVQKEKLVGFSGLRFGNGATVELDGAVDLAFGVEDFLHCVIVANANFQWTGPPAENARYTIIIAQGGAGGFTLAWPAGVLWEGGTAPVITPAAGAVSVIELVGLLNPLTFAWGVYGRARLNYL